MLWKEYRWYNIYASFKVAHHRGDDVQILEILRQKTEKRYPNPHPVLELDVRILHIPQGPHPF